MVGVALLAAAALAASARPSSAETLADAIELAYRANPTLQGQRYALRATDESYVQALTGLRPRMEVQVTGTYSRQDLGKSARQTLRQTAPFLPDYNESNTGDGQLVMEQPLYTGGRVSAQISGADAAVRAGREQLRSTEGDVLLQVIEAYVTVRRDAEAVAIRRTNLDALTHQLAETRARKEAGEVTLTDVSQAEAQLASERSLLMTAQGQLQASRAAYASLVGQNPGELSPEPPLPGSPPTVEAAFDLAEAASPDLQQARFVEQQTRADVAAARAANRPQLSLRGSYGFTGRLEPFDKRNYDRELTAQAVITQPIFTGGLNASLIRQQLDRDSSARIQVEAVRRAVVQNVANAWNQAVVSRANVLSEAEHVRAAGVAFRGMREEYRVGQRTTLDVLIAEETLRDAELSLISARRDAYVGEAGLLRAVGRLEARSLVSGVEQYDPASNLRTVERRGATPWDPLVRAIDGAGRPSAGRRPLKGPPAPESEPRSYISPKVPNASDQLATGVPDAAIPGTDAAPH